MIRVAILDSGIDKSSVSNKVIQIVNVTNETEYDLNGHGTNVFNFIELTDNYCEYIIVKVLDKNGRTNIKYLCDSLEILLKYNVNLVCLAASVVVGNNKTEIMHLKKFVGSYIMLE